MATLVPQAAGAALGKTGTVYFSALQGPGGNGG